MGKYEMVALVILIITIGAVYIATRSQGNGQTGNTMKKQDQRISDIEERLKVVESIVTSDGYDLKQKFKNLDN